MEAREVCNSPDELQARKEVLSSDPARISVPYSDPRYGEFGFVSFREDPKDEDKKVVVYRPFGGLTPLDRVVRRAEPFVESFLIHQCHKGKFFRISDPEARTKGFVCYCEASSGYSHVVMIPLTRLKEIVESFSEEAKQVYELIRTDDENILELILKSHRG
jgi:hypothetical protein